LTVGFTESGSIHYIAAIVNNRKEVIQCLIVSAGTSLGTLTRLRERIGAVRGRPRRL